MLLWSRPQRSRRIGIRPIRAHPLHQIHPTGRSAREVDTPQVRSQGNLHSRSCESVHFGCKTRAARGLLRRQRQSNRAHPKRITPSHLHRRRLVGSEPIAPKLPQRKPCRRDKKNWLLDASWFHSVVNQRQNGNRTQSMGEPVSSYRVALLTREFDLLQAAPPSAAAHPRSRRST